MDKKTRKFIEENWFKLSIITILGIVSLSLIFIAKSALINQPKMVAQQEEGRRQMEWMLRESEAASQKQELDDCMDAATLDATRSIKYWVDWSNEECTESKYSNVTILNQCLDSALLEIGKAKEEEKDQHEKCIKLYK